MKQDILDFEGKKVTHGKANVNGTCLHYYTAGQGEPLMLIHGVPKTSYYWRKLVPHLSKNFFVIVPDMPGLGDSGVSEHGYDMVTVSECLMQLVNHLGIDKLNVAGEDWGAAMAYAMAARYPEKVLRLGFMEMTLPGLGAFEERAYLTPENVNNNNFRAWHLSFYSVPLFPELLITGRERIYFDYFFKDETYDPNIPDDAMEEIIRCYSKPGGIAAMCGYYRAIMKDAEFDQEAVKTKLKMPVLALGSKYYFTVENVADSAHLVAENVSCVSMDYGHQLAEECPEEFAREIEKFFRN